MIGPCLCGDPYCPSCGDPSRAAQDDAVDKIAEKLMALDEHEMAMVDRYIDHVKNTADIRNEIIAEQANNFQMEIQQLNDIIDQLKEENGK